MSKLKVFTIMIVDANGAHSHNIISNNAENAMKIASHRARGTAEIKITNVGAVMNV